MSACRSCGAEITWARTEAGKLMPVELDEGGTLAVRRFSAHAECRALVMDETPAADEQRAVSHFALCPQADQHRRKR